MTRSPPDPASPVLGFESRGGRLQVTFGSQRIDAGPMAPTLRATLIAGLEEVLGGRAVAGGQHRLALDEHGTRRLGVRHHAGGLELSLLDVNDRPMVAPHALPLAGFARAVEAFVGRGADHPRLTDLHALVDWAEALDHSDEPGSAAPAEFGEDGDPRAMPPRRLPTRPLPVGDLFHLAYRRAWRHEAPGLVEMTADDERVMVFDTDGLRLLDRATGAVRCEHTHLRPLDGPRPMRCAVDADERPVLLDRDGALRWRGPAPLGPAPLHGLHPTKLCVLAVTAGREVYGLDPTTGAALWRYETHYGEVFGAAARGRLAWLTAEDGFVHGLDLERGERRFAVNPGGLDGRPHLTPAGLLVGLDDAGASQLLCLDPLDGRTRWSAALPGHIGRAPLYAGRAVVAIVEHGAEPLVAVLEAETGAVRWQRPLDGPDLPVARVLDGLLVLKHIDGSAIALEPRSGATRWLLAGDDPELMLRSNPPPVGCRGLVLVPGTTIRAVDPADGRIVHRIDCGELVPDRLHVWADGDLAIAEHDAVARYLLGGHLARVR